tara:strand:- start:1715 stop:2368 length:654 start_codon:yes stop_codon:yes gene_type:complete
MYSPVKSKKSRKKSPKARKTKKRSIKNKSKTKTKSKTAYTISTPTSLSAFPDKSPQLQHPEKTRLNLFTTQNINMKDPDSGREYNKVISGKFAYKRPPRNSNMDGTATIIWGPKAEKLTKTTYKKLKKGTKLWYDRGSTAFRGPFIFQSLSKGPTLEMKAKDIGYDTVYDFIIKVSELKDHTIYFEPSKKNKTAKKTKKAKKSKKRKTKKNKSRRKK